MSEIKTEIKLSSKSKSKNKIDNNLLTRLKSIISILKSFLTLILKTSVIMTNVQLKYITINALGLLNLKYLFNKNNNSIINSKGNKNKIPADKFKIYINFFMDTCYSLLVLINNRKDREFFKLLIFYIIRQLFLIYVNIKDLVLLKSYLTDIYEEDKFMISNVLNKLSLENLINLSYIDLINLKI